jgi:hypothetical protein
MRIIIISKISSHSTISGPILTEMLASATWLVPTPPEEGL